MRLIRNFSGCPPTHQGAVIALGNFDGVHLGHQAILRRCLDIARAAARPAAVMTFEPHPREFFARGGERLRIYPLRRKLELFREFGMDAVFLARFNREFSSLSAEQFVDSILSRALQARHVVTGEKFAFGKDRGGDTEFLKRQAEKSGFGFTACPPVLDASGQPISSSAIRAALAAGDMARAQALLGRPYAIAGRVRHGEKRGRQLGFPTANLTLATLCLPRFGIYAVRAALGNDKTWHDGAASLGVRPMFDGDTPLLEVHLLEGQRDMYGVEMKVEFMDFMRDERRFDAIESLQAQMRADCARAREILYALRP